MPVNQRQESGKQNRMLVCSAPNRYTYREDRRKNGGRQENYAVHEDKQR